MLLEGAVQYAVKHLFADYWVIHTHHVHPTFIMSDTGHVPIKHECVKQYNYTYCNCVCAKLWKPSSSAKYNI